MLETLTLIAAIAGAAYGAYQRHRAKCADRKCKSAEHWLANAAGDIGTPKEKLDRLTSAAEQARKVLRGEAKDPKPEPKHYCLLLALILPLTGCSALIDVHERSCAPIIPGEPPVRAFEWPEDTSPDPAHYITIMEQGRMITVAPVLIQGEPNED